MIIVEPTTEEREALKAQQAHRFPELRYFPKPGDDGKPVRLPVVLGNPSGACKMPSGMRASKAWADTVTVTFKTQREAFDYAPLISDCVLWPLPAVWSAWVNRWPALPESVRPALMRKYGGSVDQVSEPGAEVETPLEIASALADAPGSTWQRFKPKGCAPIDYVVRAPPSGVWGMFTEAMKEPGADTWTLARDFATSSVVASTRPIAEVFARWPGFPLLVDNEASYLAGLATDYEEGEL